MQYILDYLKYVNVSLGYNIIYMLLRNYEAIDLGHWCLDNQGFTRIGTCTTLEIFIMHCQIHRLYHIILGYITLFVIYVATYIQIIFSRDMKTFV